MLFCPTQPDWTPQWTGGPIYMDARDF
jgi:hypothetical protein